SRLFFSRFLLVLAFLVAGVCHALADITVTASTAPLAADARTITIQGSGIVYATSVTFNNGATGDIALADAAGITVIFTRLPSPGILTAVVTNGAESSGTPVQVATVQPPVAHFYAAGQSALATDGTFRVTVNLSAPPSKVFASGMIFPKGMAYDQSGNLYVAGFSENVVYKVTPNGTMSVFATGLDGPWGLAFGSGGKLYVSNYDSNTVSVVTTTGMVSPFASGFNKPQGLAFDSTGRLYVANSQTGTISRVTSTGVVSTFATGFAAPSGLALDGAGNLYVSESLAFSGKVTKRTSGGAVSTVVSGLNLPAGLAFDSAGNLYVANSADYAGGIPSVMKVTPGGQVSTVASAGLGIPSGLVFDSTGNLCVSDPRYKGVFKLLNAVTVPFTIGGTAVAGTDYSGVTANPLTFNFGQASATITGTLLLNSSATATPRTLSFTLGSPTGATLGGTVKNTVTILQRPSVQFNATSETVSVGVGTFSVPATLTGRPTFAGGAAFSETVFGSGLSFVSGLGCDAVGNLYAANASDGTIRKVTPGGVTSILASGFAYPFCLTADATGNCYVISSGMLQKVAPDGTVKILAWTIDRGSGLVCDNSGNVYVATIVGGKWAIVKYSAIDGGLGVPFATGFPNFIIGMAFGADGCLYCGDQSGQIRKVAADGSFSLFSSVANYASGIVVDATDRLYVTDAANHTISLITPDGVANQVVSGLDASDCLALDAAGNLYVGGTNGVTKFSPTINVPFTLSGTSVSGVDYTAL
ncbi:MAG TPA: hypothetical protein VK968_10895, partial [Roseimicrobium sp.]|nr:hypothetical protein [Roseimicrobium sp.]